MPRGNGSIAGCVAALSAVVFGAVGLFVGAAIGVSSDPYVGKAGPNVIKGATGAAVGGLAAGVVGAGLGAAVGALVARVWRSGEDDD